MYLNKLWPVTQSSCVLVNDVPYVIKYKIKPAKKNQHWDALNSLAAVGFSEAAMQLSLPKGNEKKLIHHFVTLLAVLFYTGLFKAASEIPH